VSRIALTGSVQTKSNIVAAKARAGRREMKQN
jgi:hypothetical protein